MAALTLALAVAIGAARLPLLGRDFLLFWTAGRAVQTGVSPYDMDFQARTQQANGWDTSREVMPFNPYSYPPWLAVGLVPLAWLPYPAAFSLWLAISVVALAVSLMALLKMASQAVGRLALAVTLIGGFTFAPALNGLSVGQLNAVLFALVAGLIWGLDAHHDRAAGVCMGLLATKPHVGLIVAGVVSLGLIARRRFTPIVWAASTVAVCAGVSFLVSPTWPGDLLASFDAFTARTGFTWPLNGFQDNPTAFAALRVSAGSSSLAFALTMAGLSILAGLSVYRMRRGPPPSLQWLGAAGCAALFVFAPYARAYDLVFLLWPLIYLVFSNEVAVPARARLGLGALIYLAPIGLLGIGGQGVSNFAMVMFLAAALLVAPARGRR